MTIVETYRALTNLQTTRTYPCLSEDELDQFCNGFVFPVPREHLEFLELSDGMEVHNGYFRLFGVRSHQWLNLQSWNERELWKFAWGDAVEEYFLFGETAWGDQYAYHFDDLKKQGDSAPVYFLDAIEMDPEVIHENFSAFLRDEFLRNAEKPYDSILRTAVKKFGPLGIDEHLIHMPSILIGGDDSINYVEKLDAISSMIINGDILRQVSSAPDDAIITSVSSYADDQGRQRIRINWDNDSSINYS